MAGIRKVSRPTQHEDFRRRLERALSLSPSDSDSIPGSSSSAEGDTTEIESLEENNFPRLQHKTGTICSDLDDIAQRLVAVEAATEAINSETQSTTEENN
ncbi:hypothetical protein N7513_003610 [Penicillium frequentans]|nr:hypothetical protein N7513_003610 [Penicillium glabrum]